MRQGQLIALVGVIAVLAASGCTKEKREAVIIGSAASSGPATLPSIQSDLFRLSCATSGCHDNRATPASNLGLSSTQQSFAALVNRASTEATQMKLVVPGNADASYLVNKLLGTHGSVGGSGAQMPQYASPLNASDIQRVIDWINAGAAEN